MYWGEGLRRPWRYPCTAEGHQQQPKPTCPCAFKMSLLLYPQSRTKTQRHYQLVKPTRPCSSWRPCRSRCCGWCPTLPLPCHNTRHPRTRRGERGGGRGSEGSGGVQGRCAFGGGGGGACARCSRPLLCHLQGNLLLLSLDLSRIPLPRPPRAPTQPGCGTAWQAVGLQLPQPQARGRLARCRAVRGAGQPACAGRAAACVGASG